MAMTDIITLDVGGTVFKTSRGTLVKYEDSVLAKMFNPESTRPPAAVTETGAYFMDRNPEV